MKKNLAVDMIVMVVAMTCAYAQGKEYFVVQKDPAAADTNPGTEAKPFKTIQAAVDKAQAGDTIWVKEGVYEEALEPKSSGRADAPITLSAWKDDRVCLGSILYDLPPAEQWKPVEKSKIWAVQLPADQPKDITVILDGKPIVTEVKDAPPLEANANWATYRASDRTLMVNLGGGGPKDHTLHLARDLESFCETEQFGYWAFKKLEFAWVHQGLALDGNCNLVEDCYFHDVFAGGIGIRGAMGTIRRCNFHRCAGAVHAGGTANIMEDCLIVECGADWKDVIMERRANARGEPHSAVESKGGSLHTCRYNIIADNFVAGLWYDCHMVGARVIGNAFWDNHGTGFENESSPNDTLVIGNYFLNNKMLSGTCTRLSVLDNFFQGCSVVWSCHDCWPLRNSFMTLRGNAVIDPPGSYLAEYGPAWGPSRFPRNFKNCLVDFNHVRVRQGTPLIDDGGKKVRTIEEIRKDYGWEIHGEFGVYDKDKNDLTPESLGGSVMTFRVPWGPKSYLARPMLSDAGINGTWPCTSEMCNNNISTPSFFWRFSDGNYSQRIFGEGHENFIWPWYCNDLSWQPDCGNTGGDETAQCHGCQWYVGADEDFGKDADGKPKKLEKGWYTSALSLGNRWLVVKGVMPEKVPPQGLGFWTPWLATVEGAKMTVSLKIRGKDIVPTEKGCPAVYLQFTSATGQDRKRAYLVGGEPASGGTGVSPVARPELIKGSYDWTNVKEMIVAPKGAIRMALFMGVQPCKGEVDFDNINLTTESASAPPANKQEILPPRLPIARIKETFYVDLSKVANRALADEEDNNGKGGWTDQGPAADMRLLATGERKFGGVPMKILPPPKCIVVLKSTRRKPGDLPEKVTIPVGRKVDTLFFLHACAWAPENGKEAFRYVLHYKDGKDVTIPVIAGQRITDWIASPVRRFAGEEKTFTTVADTVPVPQFGQGSVYRIEWGCPVDRRAVELESIEFAGDGQSVPILLAVTGVVEW